MGCRCREPGRVGAWRIASRRLPASESCWCSVPGARARRWKAHARHSACFTRSSLKAAPRYSFRSGTSGDVESTRRVGGYQAIEFATRYENVVDIIQRAADRLQIGVLGFNDMSVEQVARECGLSLLEARLAKLREYGEPFRLLRANPLAERRLWRALEAAGLTCRRGGDFHHAGAAKGPQAAIAVLTTLYRIAFGSVLTAGASDGTGQADILRTWIWHSTRSCWTPTIRWRQRAGWSGSFMKSTLFARRGPRPAGRDWRGDS